LHAAGGNDRLFGGAGDDRLAGGSGVDVARFEAKYAEANLSRNADGDLVVISNADDTDTLSDIELLSFEDRVVLVRIPELAKEEGFDENFYLISNPDVASAVMHGDFSSGYQHYQLYGAAEGRETGALSGFDESFYLHQNPDVAVAVVNNHYSSGYQHYRQYGDTEGRNPNVLFDELWYRKTNPDVEAAIEQGVYECAYEHYLAYGSLEARAPSAWMDTSTYLATNPDVASAGINPLTHFLEYGAEEGRVIVSADDWAWL
ncbi:hypothetical protein BIS07_20800, partial [Halomonas sp. FL8]|nr:hypothetical protein [Halomonas sp. FL8]